MALYTDEAVKICPPEETLKRALEVVDKYKMVANGIISYEFRNQDEFGMLAATLLMKPEKFYELFPEDFPYLKDVDTFWFHKVSGKGLHRAQCSVSMFMEFFERLSIEFKIHETKPNRVIKTCSEYIDYLNTTNSDLAKIMSVVLSTKAPDAKVGLVETEELISGQKVLFPLKLLFQGSNGYAAGNEYHESIVHGIFEVVERFTQTLFVIKCLGAGKDEIAKRAKKSLYGFDLDLCDLVDSFEPFVVDVPSLVKEFPDLEEVINNLSRNFDKFEIVDLSMEFNGIKYYNYIIRQGVESTGFKLSTNGGCHFNQRIAILRALTEASQGYADHIRYDQAWNGYLFTKMFIDSVFDYPLPVKPFVRDPRNYTDMEDIYNDCIRSFKQIICIDCTIDKIGIPVLSLYIPELYNKSFLWSYIFCTTQVGDVDLLNFLGENNVSQVYNYLTEKSITGVMSLYFFENYGLVTEFIRKKMFYLYLSYLADKDFFAYILENMQNEPDKDNIKRLFDSRTEPEISTTISIDKKDCDSFIAFHDILSKTDKTPQDIEYLAGCYAKMGFIDYAIDFAAKYGCNIDAVIEEYLPYYSAIAEYSESFNMFNRYIDAAKKVYKVTKDEALPAKIEECKAEQDEIDNKLRIMLGKKDDKNTIFGLTRGDMLGDWSLSEMFQVGEFCYQIGFEEKSKNKTQTMRFTISIVRRPEFKMVTDNDFYLDYSTGIFNGAKKRLANDFIALVESLE